MTLDHELTTQADLSVELLDDNDLLRLTREGSDEAYAALYERYVYPARRLARHLGQREDSDDVVADAFAQILDLLKRGKGPDRAFRAYLFTTIRHESGRRAKARARVTLTDDENTIDTPVPFGDGQLDDFEKTAIRAAYESLPDRWRTVLWHLDVEGHRASDLADVMGLKPNSVSALVYRARSGLRDAYLQQHVGDAPESLPAACAAVRDKLATALRRSATPREQAKVHAHLNSCSDCMAVYLSLQEVNRDIGAILTPAALAGAIGGGAVLLGVGSGSAALAHLFTAAKAFAIAAVPAAAAVTVTTVVVVDAMSPSQPTTSAAPVARTASPVPTERPAAAGPARADAAATPKVVKGSHADALPAVPFGNSVPGAGTPSHRTSTPSTPAPTPTPTRQTTPVPSPVDVGVDRDGIDLSVGPVKVSTGDVEDTVDKLLQLPKDLLSGLVPAPAPTPAPTP